MERRMKQDNLYFGSWLTRPDMGVVELMAKSGYFQWLVVDIEHNAFSMREIENLVRVIQLAGLESYVRLSENNHVLIKRVLDIGVDGIIIPMVNSKQDAFRAVNACLYKPQGVRGVGLSRVQNYSPEGFEKYMQTNKQIKIIVQIEDCEAVKNIDDIFSVDGLFGYLIGPYDLSASIGMAGDFDAKQVLSMIEIVKKSAEKHGIPAGYHIIEPSQQEISNKIAEGYRIIVVSLDMLFLKRGIDSVFKK
jgi:2-dehydro-3-deoxyglucarate aldolase